MMLFGHELLHIFVYISFVFPIYFFFAKHFTYKSFLVGILTTLLIDFDHLFDYLYFKGFGFKLTEFLSGRYFDLSGKVFVPFHSWEVVLLLIILYLTRYKKSWILFISIGIAAHLVLDLVYYGLPFHIYFLVHRAINGFNSSLY